MRRLARCVSAAASTASAASTAAYESRWRQAAASAAVTEEMACEYELSLLALEDIKARTNDKIDPRDAVALVEWLMGYVISMRLREILPVSSLRNAMRSGATSVEQILMNMSESGVSRDCYDELERCLKGWQMRLLAL